MQAGDKYLSKPLDEEKPHAPEIVMDLTPVRVMEGEPAKFTVRVVGSPLPKVEWILNGQSIRKSKRYEHRNVFLSKRLTAFNVFYRFRIWQDGIYYFEIMAVRSYDHGELRMVATNKIGRVESKVAVEVYQAEDFRQVLHKAEKTATSAAGNIDPALQRYRIARHVEDEAKGKNIILQINM